MGADDGAGPGRVGGGQGWRTTVTGLLRRPDWPGEPQYLVLPGRLLKAEHPALPTWSTPKRLGWHDTATIGQGFREHAGLDVVVLDCLVQVDEAAARQRHALYAVELRPGAQPSAGAQWLGTAAVQRLRLPGATLRAALAARLEEAATDAVPPQRNPWAREGWFAAAAAWMAGACAACGRPLVGPVLQVQSWSISSVLRAPTATGDVYLKAVPPLFALEPRITHALAARHPRHVPPVLAADLARRWTLLGDAGASLRRVSDPAVWERVLRCYADVQRAWGDEAEALRALGCPDRRLPALASELEALAEALDARPEGPGTSALDEVPPATAARLRAALPRLRALCAELVAAGPAATLVHGDLHGGNVAWRDGEPVFFDWTDACLAHPFVDMATLWSDDPAAPLAPHYPRLRDAYLEAWTDGTPAPRLRAAFEQALTLGAFFQAVSYHRIVRSLEPAACHEWAGARPAWLRQGLARLDASAK
jgi:hypothetical protein